MDITVQYCLARVLGSFGLGLVDETSFNHLTSFHSVQLRYLLPVCVFVDEAIHKSELEPLFILWMVGNLGDPC